MTAITVLIAEDDGDLRELWAACIAGMNGFEVLTSATCRQTAHLMDQADVLLLDLMLEDGEAYGVFREWVEAKGADSCAIISGYVETDYRARLILEGAAHVESKPLPVHILLTYMRRFERWIKIRWELAEHSRIRDAQQVEIGQLRVQVAQLETQVRQIAARRTM